MWTARRHQKVTNAHVRPCYFQYIQIVVILLHHVLLGKKKRLRVRVVGWLGFGCPSGTVQRQPPICWIASVQKENLLLQLCLYFSVMKLAAGPIVAPAWGSMVKCKVYTVLCSAGTP